MLVREGGGAGEDLTFDLVVLLSVSVLRRPQKRLYHRGNRCCTRTGTTWRRVYD